MEVKPERIAEIIRKIDPNNNMSVSELADAIMQDLEKDRKLSDLEIVQKALSCSYASICEDGRWFVENNYDGDLIAKGQGMQSLLTWAKQTIGVE